MKLSPSDISVSLMAHSLYRAEYYKCIRFNLSAKGFVFGIKKMCQGNILLGNKMAKEWLSNWSKCKWKHCHLTFTPLILVSLDTQVGQHTVTASSSCFKHAHGNFTLHLLQMHLPVGILLEALMSYYPHYYHN